MESAVNLIAWDLPKSGIDLVRPYDTRAPVRVVPGKIEQVILNLILNARSAMHGRRGRLTVAVTSDADGVVALKVQDTGCGIPLEHVEKIFDPFFTTRPRGNDNGNGHGQRSGAGLGLPVARDLVRQAGGDIRVESTPGVGSTFTVLLPVAQ
jgi:signal transduction histidine kinase